MSRRITLDLTDAADAEIQRLVGITDLESAADIFRTGLSLLRIHVEAARSGETIYKTDAEGYRERITLPFSVRNDP